LAKDFKVIYYDQRACGRSAIPSPDSISMKFLVEDLEALRKDLKINTLDILAHSWGAVLAVHYARSYPGNIGKLILSNPAMLSREYDAEAARLSKAKTSKADSLKRAELMASGPMDLKKYNDFFLLSFKTSAYDPNNLQNLNLDLPETFPEASKALFSGLMKDPAALDNLYMALDKLNFPVLIINGKADIIPPASLERLQKNLPQAELATFERSGHFPFIEEGEKFIQVVKTFLQKKRASRPVKK
jgi:proline iminopeptidase